MRWCLNCHTCTHTHWCLVYSPSPTLAQPHPTDSGGLCKGTQHSHFAQNRAKGHQNCSFELEVEDSSHLLIPPLSPAAPGKRVSCATLCPKAWHPPWLPRTNGSIRIPNPCTRHPGQLSPWGWWDRWGDWCPGWEKPPHHLTHLHDTIFSATARFPLTHVLLWLWA